MVNIGIFTINESALMPLIHSVPDLEGQVAVVFFVKKHYYQSSFTNMQEIKVNQVSKWPAQGSK